MLQAYQFQGKILVFLLPTHFSSSFVIPQHKHLGLWPWKVFVSNQVTRNMEQYWGLNHKDVDPAIMHNKIAQKRLEFLTM